MKNLWRNRYWNGKCSSYSFSTVNIYFSVMGFNYWISYSKSQTMAFNVLIVFGSIESIKYCFYVLFSNSNSSVCNFYNSFVSLPGKFKSNTSVFWIVFNSIIYNIIKNLRKLIFFTKYKYIVCDDAINWNPSLFD